MSNEDAKRAVHVKWNNHDKSASKEYYESYLKGEFTDVSIATNDKVFKCHKVVLAACSEYFRQIFQSSDESSLALHDVSTEHFAKLLQYVYSGEAEVLKEELQQFLELAGLLKIK